MYGTLAAQHGAEHGVGCRAFVVTGGDMRYIDATNRPVELLTHDAGRAFRLAREMAARGMHVVLRTIRGGEMAQGAVPQEFAPIPVSTPWGT